MCADSLDPVKALEIAPCRKENLGGVHELIEASPQAAAWSRGALADAYERYPACFLVAWQGEEIAGFIVGRAVSDEGEILNLAVRQQSRRQGVGKALVKSLLENFARLAVFQVFLEVRESNALAIAFYQGLGFRQTGRREGYYREPDEAALMLTLECALQSGTTGPTG